MIAEQNSGPGWPAGPAAAWRLALTDAIAYRETHGQCGDCKPGRPCPDRRSDEAMARQYRALLERLPAAVVPP